MSSNCSTMNGVLEFAITSHTVQFINDSDILITDCAGVEKFRCDLSANTLALEVVVTAGIGNLRLGRPLDLPLTSPDFVTQLDFADSSMALVFEKQIQGLDVGLVGTHDLRYDCTDEVFVSPGNGYKRYEYQLDQCRVHMSKAGTIVTIRCGCDSNPCGAQPHAGFRVVSALKA